jgi:hypothetical protein
MSLWHESSEQLKKNFLYVAANDLFLLHSAFHQPARHNWIIARPPCAPGHEDGSQNGPTSFRPLHPRRARRVAMPSVRFADGR